MMDSFTIIVRHMQKFAFHDQMVSVSFFFLVLFFKILIEFIQCYSVCVLDHDS